MNLDESFKLLERAREIIPHQTQTFSRAASSFIEGLYPVYIDHASGSHFTDVDGNDFLDYLLGLGPITLGYAYHPVDSSIIAQLKKGILFSLPHRIEVELSELISQTIPHADMVKFEKTGSNAVTAAVRAARALTKRDKIAYCGSGGVWHDWQGIMVSRNDGIPKFNRDLIKIFDYNDIGGLEQIFEDNVDEIAAIVIEPTYLQAPTNDFLKKVRKIADRTNSILIFDEIVTGFRFHIQGGQKYYDVKADLVCFGKGMGNGLPISAITGQTEFMKIFDSLWVSSTNNSEALSLAGTIAVINEMKEKKTIDYCWKIGRELFYGWNKIVGNYNLDAKMIGYPVRMTLKAFDSMNIESISLKSLILQELIKKGVFLSSGPNFISYSHSKSDLEHTLSSLDDVCKFITKNAKNEEYDSLLEGKTPKTIWTMSIKSTKAQKI